MCKKSSTNWSIVEETQAAQFHAMPVLVGQIWCRQFGEMLCLSIWKNCVFLQPTGLNAITTIYSLWDKHVTYRIKTWVRKITLSQNHSGRNQLTYYWCPSVSFTYFAARFDILVMSICMISPILQLGLMGWVCIFLPVFRKWIRRLFKAAANGGSFKKKWVTKTVWLLV